MNEFLKQRFSGEDLDIKGKHHNKTANTYLI